MYFGYEYALLYNVGCDNDWDSIFIQIWLILLIIGEMVMYMLPWGLRWIWDSAPHVWVEEKGKKNNKNNDMCTHLRVEVMTCVLPKGLRWKHEYCTLLMNQVWWLADYWVVLEFYLFVKLLIVMNWLTLRLYFLINWWPIWVGCIDTSLIEKLIMVWLWILILLRLNV